MSDSLVKRWSLLKGQRRSLSGSCQNLLRTVVDKLAQAQCFDERAQWSRDQLSTFRVVGKKSTGQTEAVLFITLLLLFLKTREW